MLIPLGFLAGSGGVAGSYELIESSILTSTTASVTFSSIPQDYKHLQVRYTAKTSTTRNRLWVRMNTVSTVSYIAHYLSGNGTAVGSGDYADKTAIWLSDGVAGSGTSIFASGIIDVLDYTSTSKNTTIRALTGTIGGDSGNQKSIQLASGLFINTSAITSLSLLADADALATGSRFSLYGIKG